MAGRPVLLLLLLLAGTPRSARACPGTPSSAPVSPGPAAPSEQGVRFVGRCSGLGSGGRTPVLSRRDPRSSPASAAEVSGDGGPGCCGVIEGWGRGIWGHQGDTGGGAGRGWFGGACQWWDGIPVVRACPSAPSIPPCLSIPIPSHPSLSISSVPILSPLGINAALSPGRSGWGPQGGAQARLSARSWDPPVAPFWTMATPQRFGRRR
ncbi:uncharacterized protein LOC116436610 [Corvus moneduloides]|uniref:uncharacterized protein LOC116436610 n=1 Tax=Corvus moneduloides TaxID=1196302 RepID=UPI0013624955|nr:uncharacterized protein LOC116436610 [Corvus moneduloides]